ncbi:fatty acyl-CoA reductase wat isoform X1 [Cephus cinctus]|uniref:Fatty acyl-CoA reductase n=1 Tax=Cephus cinctus TaxID=211228 RepID=A0AAJ7BI29_CEPCN|nr:fatty acyl-CoA reductase wat isoform X1 [Cephus cinctus]
MSSIPEALSEIQQFYKGANIFITGGTGFLGKILIEKLLRSCPGIGNIYVLVRFKRGKRMEERMDKLLSDNVFSVLKKENPDYKKKLIGINGDGANSGLGVSPEDRLLLTNEVSIIFHAAATVRFDEPLNVAVAINVNSVKDIIDLSKDCKKLKACVYVSTAFSNCIQKKICETIYTPPLTYEESNMIVDILERQDFSKDIVGEITQKLIGKWPNTYTFTKAIAEGVINKFARNLPISIIRPSIVLATWKEPLPGWTDNLLGVNGIVAGVAVGAIHVMHLDKNKKCDLVPVDMVCNAIIACAWETGITKRRPEEDIPVYNYVTGPENPITWMEFQSLAHSIGYKSPTNAAIYYNTVIYTKYQLLYTIFEFFFHLIPALVVDNITKLIGKEPILYKMHKKLANLTRVLSFFTTQEWTYENFQMQKLWNRLSNEDKRLFPSSLTLFKWHDLVKTHIFGMKKYIMNDKEGNESEARRRQIILYIIHTAVRLLFVFFVIWLIWKIFH